jgi:hypothetical protein
MDAQSPKRTRSKRKPDPIDELRAATARAVAKLEQQPRASSPLATSASSVAPPPTTTPAPTITVTAIYRPKRHWLLGFICLIIGLALGFVGLAINARYNASTGQTTEYSYWMSLLGFGADLACLFLPAICSRLRVIEEPTLARTIFVVWIIATVTTLYTTESFLALNIGDTAQQRHNLEQSAADTRNQRQQKIDATSAAVASDCPVTWKQKQRPSPDCLKSRAAYDAAISSPIPQAATVSASDPGAHNIAQTFAWFGLHVEEQTIQIVRTAFLAILPACAGLILSACVPLFGRRQQ